MFDNIMDFLKSIDPLLMAVVGSGLLDFLFRLFPTQKPFDLMRLIVVSIRKISNILEKIAEMLDKVLPQNVK